MRHQSRYPPIPRLRGSAAAAGTLAMPVQQFRLTAGGNEWVWFSDDLGGIGSPGDPPPTRRDFLMRLFLAGVAITVGGGINALTTTAARKHAQGTAPSQADGVSSTEGDAPRKADTP